MAMKFGAAIQWPFHPGDFLRIPWKIHSPCHRTRWCRGFRWGLSGTCRLGKKNVQWAMLRFFSVKNHLFLDDSPIFLGKSWDCPCSAKFTYRTSSKLRPWMDFLGKVCTGNHVFLTRWLVAPEVEEGRTFLCLELVAHQTPWHLRNQNLDRRKRHHRF